MITLPETMKVNSYAVSEVTATATGMLTNLSEVTMGNAELFVQFDSVSVSPELPDGDYTVNVSGSYSAAWSSDNGLAVTGSIFDNEVDEEVGNNTPITGTFADTASIVVDSGTVMATNLITGLMVNVEGDTISTSNGAVSDVTVGDVTYKAGTDTYTR